MVGDEALSLQRCPTLATEKSRHPQTGRRPAAAGPGARSTSLTSLLSSRCWWLPGRQATSLGLPRLRVPQPTITTLLGRLSQPVIPDTWGGVGGGDTRRMSSRAAWESFRETLSQNNFLSKRLEMQRHKTTPSQRSGRVLEDALRQHNDAHRPPEPGSAVTTVPQVGKQTSREVQWPAQSHTDIEWRSWDLNLGSLSRTPPVLSSCANPGDAHGHLLPAKHTTGLYCNEPQVPASLSKLRRDRQATQRL